MGDPCTNSRDTDTKRNFMPMNGVQSQLCGMSDFKMSTIQS